ncbi:MAG: TIGR00730 family Rossman fold protein [Hyphomicrobiales bacterium]|nr:TIGR00730 family Rossman fold protein [Hyphomicrobiales bacterium]
MGLAKNVCVYCGSGEGRDPAFAAGAEALGRAFAAAGVGLVYGGGGHGLMGRLALAQLAAGGRVTGVIPDFLRKLECPVNASAQELIVVPDMHQRKQTMFERADAFVALPGGIGTLEELVEQLTWSQLARHTKPIVLADINGFWRPLLSLIAHMRQNGFIRPDLELHYLVAERIGDVLPMIETALERQSAPVTTVDPRL